MGAAQLVADPVHHRLPQVRLKGAVVLWAKVLKVLQCLKDRLLDKVLRVRKVARPPREAAACPFAKRRQIPAQQTVERVGISSLRSFEQLERGFRIDDRGHGPQASRYAAMIPATTELVQPFVAAGGAEGSLASYSVPCDRCG